MANIGAISVTVWKGILTSAVYGSQLYEQGGVDGYGVVFGGKKAPPQRIITVTRIGTTNTDFNAAQASYRALMRTSVSVTDQFAITWPGVIVMGVSVSASYDPIGYIATAEWMLLVQST